LAPSLNGKVIAYLEARMRSEMGSLIQRHGGVPYSAPVLQEIYLKDSPDVQRLVEDVCTGAVDVVVLLTGVGTQALVEAADALGRKDEFVRCLDQRTIVARSPKPARVLRQHHVHIDIMPPEPFTTNELNKSVEALDLQGKQVAVQSYGAPNSVLTRNFIDRGATVREVTLYSWGLPEDHAPVLRMIDDLSQGKIDALAFTSQPQAKNLITIAEQADKVESLRQSLNGPAVVVGSVGPVCTRGLGEAGIQVNVEPDHPHMGNLVQALADYLGSRMVQMG
jgi:uroporphyrinogen-III synthase